MEPYFMPYLFIKNNDSVVSRKTWMDIKERWTDTAKDEDLKNDEEQA